MRLSPVAVDNMMIYSTLVSIFLYRMHLIADEMFANCLQLCPRPHHGSLQRSLDSIVSRGKPPAQSHAVINYSTLTLHPGYSN